MREKTLTGLIEAKVVEATQVCETDRDFDKCKVAWDEVEEVSQAKADLLGKWKRIRICCSRFVRKIQKRMSVVSTKPETYRTVNGVFSGNVCFTYYFVTRACLAKLV
ncbi:putative calvin cycle protein CP12 [Helianthus annuus]|uniref:Calvin cycle protein CP12 n=1 Tax=Helianthus annuus TaxID=4232 RepID=A0A9K3N5U9_HELAN|nr:putative calvin cycle protein CP12 [Helianthus annuus]KAJ0514810.1 putative calvin cycle protein CP12 [Helianthus annuus]KAJ0523116.1 putative calvin cycle protein CP12 [Helianthus annuus]KAJ0530975.1 putative calvin cycle protein CP12 [Helianthus annuus]KAJ0701198.1 putative calvin cycle protein CP12 [Helianthus annuus]